ncbi:hypothetical protein [Sandaracinus amylolyticus]|uniref:hypothetical protein n=1 Tax=Sandaracinus amylolyticus TaxID=927083 RepID=UPI001F44ABD6|nr:hypothetical protein [Sandaracinus amylolyticus]UJR81479.1 Hypothetical protein I5071_35380 [Sandaracinus amylolyticus]
MTAERPDKPARKRSGKKRSKPPSSPSTAMDVARALVAEGDPESWRKPMASTLRTLLAELDRRVALGGDPGGLSTLELIGALGKLGAIATEAESLLGPEVDPKG